VRAVVIADDRSLEVRDLERPQPAEGQVRVRVAACGICGSDLHMRPSEALPPGTVMGHELAGEVEELGPGVDTVAVGQRVCVYPFRPVDRHDLEVAMTTGIGMGGGQGAYAEAVIVRADMLWALPQEMSYEHGALVEPLAVALHGLDVAGVQASDPCAVIGAGPIGVMTSLALKARGVERLVVVEKNERRAERMRDLGVDAVPLSGVHEAALGALGGPPRIVFECAGNPAAPNLAIELVAPSGRVVLLGVLEEPVPVSQLLLMLKEAEIRSSFAYRPSSFDEALALIAAGKVPADRLVTAREPLERAQEMFDELGRPGTEHIKVLLTP
jgi:(R,R)-butanediol dehydrogenase/meso-butanediol dehydrogenase/diacetyl reductase